MTSDNDKYKKKSDPDEVNEPGGVYQPKEPMTFEMVWLMFQETDKKVRETTKSVEALSKNLGGIGNNLGEVAGDYFFKALEKLPEVAGMTATDAAIELAFKNGLLVFTQSGQKIELLNPKGFDPKEF